MSLELIFSLSIVIKELTLATWKHTFIDPLSSYRRVRFL